MKPTFRMSRLFLFALLPLLLTTAACAQPTASDTEREDRIIANLRFEFPQLAEATMVVREIVPSGIAGVERGILVINGQQEQPFLITEDDTQFYLIVTDAIDVSRDPESLASAEEERIREEARRAETRGEELAAAFANLPVRGNPDAPVTIIEFSDFQCPFCARAHTTLEQLLANNPEKVRLIYVQYPLPNHQWAEPASLSAICAGEQNGDAFWTLHDRYFEHQREMTPANVIERSRTWLAGHDIDIDQWQQCATDAASPAHQAARAELERHIQLANEHGVRGTPAFFVNGQFLSGAQPLEVFQSHVDAAAE
jgi:protein-disulfide isomerase